MIRCNQCGKCCETIIVRFDQYRIKYLHEAATKDKSMDQSFSFAYKNWTPISKEDAIRINPYLLNDRRINDPEIYFYTCKKLGQKSKLCMCHDTRPRVCAEYPVYETGVDPSDIMYSQDCPFQELRKMGRM